MERSDEKKRKEASMRLIGMTLAFLCALAFACPAHAGNSRMEGLIKATETDYAKVKTDFVGARRDGRALSAAEIREMDEVACRTKARRTTIAGLKQAGARVLPPEQRGLFRLVAESLDNINLSDFGAT